MYLVPGARRPDAQLRLLHRAPELGLELFQAERHSTGSHFRIDSTLSLVDCGSIPEVPK